MNLKVGIDKVGFYVPEAYLEMDDLAKGRGVDPAKFHLGIGQDQMSVPSKTETIIEMAVQAAKNLLTEEERGQIDMVIVGTETGVDESKAAAVTVHDRLGIQPFARSFEIKEACYAATAGLLLGRDYVQAHPERKVLVVATDIAKYGLNSPGEPTQGAGSVAMLISANPKILGFNDDNVALSQDIDDFYRPVGQAYPTVDGQLSNETYLDSFGRVWAEYAKRNQLTFKDFSAFLFHVPYTKIGKKALLSVLDNKADEDRLLAQYDLATIYNRRVGNLYTGSLWLSLVSLLDHSRKLKSGDRIGFFSYGSGSVAEVFSGHLIDGYERYLQPELNQSQLEKRRRLSLEDYEAIF